MKADLENRSVLITGGGGFIGSHLVEALLKQGAKVSAFVKYNSRSDPGLLRFLNLDQKRVINLIAGDLKDQQAVEQAMESIDLVIHLGALISIPYSYLHPGDVLQTNVIGTYNILEGCRRHGCRLIHTSTSEVYGTAQYTPIDEQHPLQGQSPYSASKIGADKLVESYFRSFGVDAVTIRPFNTYGPRQSGRAVIPTIISQALTGDVIHLGNLDARRDFTFVEDTVSGFVLAAVTEGLAGEVINLGTGYDISIGELAEKIFNLMGKSVRIKSEPERIRPKRSEVMRLISDNRKANSILKWKPVIGLDEGLKRTIDWVKEHIEIYQAGKFER